MGKLNLAIIGIGNCASALVQGIEYYRHSDDNPIGLMHLDVGGYRPRDLRVAAAFDVDSRKVGRDVSEAIFAPPNCTTVFQLEIPHSGVEVQMGPVFDGIADHMSDYPESRTFVVADAEPVDVTRVLEDSQADVLVNYLPVGSEAATRYYAEAALDAGCAFVNCIPVFIASNPKWASRFQAANVPVVGDDIKSQVGATIIHRVLARLFADRGAQIDRTYQLNTGGNTDFLNMLARDRLKSKKVSKTEAVQSQLPIPMEPENIHIGPSDYVPWQKDNKLCFLRIEGRVFGDVPLNLELRLSVEDSPNSAGCAIDAIRIAKVAMDQGVGGPLEAISASVMKHPPVQYPDYVARQMVEDFLASAMPGQGGSELRSELDTGPRAGVDD